MFIPGIFIWGDGLGEAAGIGMLCIGGVGEGVGDALGIGMPDMFFSISGVGDGDAFGAGVVVGIGIPCLCCG